jgi:uncharacterized membrane protein
MPKRIYSIDFARGLVMIIMALDHVRDLMHENSLTQSPVDLQSTTPILFFTRWITYLCAPTFVFLAGSSAYFSFKHKDDMAQSRKFLLQRGLWLIILEFTIVNFGLYFDLGFHTLIFEVIAAIGVGMIVLSFLLKLPTGVIGIIGLIILGCHNLLPGSTPLFSMGSFPISSNHIYLVAYPPIPWLGIMLVGFAAGNWFGWQESERKSLLLKIGAGALLLFLVLRFFNIYGDPFPWAIQKTTIYTILSFINISKYPPSLLFCLITLGILMFILSFDQRHKNRITDMVCVYGKVPLFYFVLHLYFIHCLLLILLFFQGFHWADLSFATGSFGRPKGIHSGVALWAIYLIWLAVVGALYKPCGWFGKYKATHKYWWLSYL